MVNCRRLPPSTWLHHTCPAAGPAARSSGRKQGGRGLMPSTQMRRAPPWQKRTALPAGPYHPLVSAQSAKLRGAPPRQTSTPPNDPPLRGRRASTCLRHCFCPAPTHLLRPPPRTAAGCSHCTRNFGMVAAWEKAMRPSCCPSRRAERRSSVRHSSRPALRDRLLTPPRIGAGRGLLRARRPQESRQGRT